MINQFIATLRKTENTVSTFNAHPIWTPFQKRNNSRNNSRRFLIRDRRQREFDAAPIVNTELDLGDPAPEVARPPLEYPPLELLLE